MKHFMTKAILGAALALTFLGFSPIAANAQMVEGARIVIVDFNRVTIESLVGQDVAAQLESNRVSVEARAGDLDTLLKSDEEELRRKRNIIAPDAVQERLRGFNQKQQEARDELQQRTLQHQRAAQHASLEIQRTLRTIILEVMNTHGATIVLDRAIIYHSTGGLDVTTEVIELLDRALSQFEVTLPNNSGR